VLEQAKPFLKPEQILVSTTKGFEEKGFKLMSQLMAEITGFQHLGVLSGPNLASELAQNS
jgi:glycerol-3-phosphate dehydrogenase (NAD(P)+)